MQFKIVKSGPEDENITVFIEGRKPLSAHSSHPNYEAIREGALADDESVVDLFDVSDAVAERFDKLSERVSVAFGRVYFDGVEIKSALTKQIVRFLNEGVDDWKPLVNFFEKVMQNPSEHSRDNLYDWIDAQQQAEGGFSITRNGNIVGYKGVRENDGEYSSVNTGRAIVNGEVQNGHISNSIGAVVEMPRSEVQFDPGIGCDVGLHIGTYNYAEGWAEGALLEVHVNPRDVVSVPTDCGAAKMRTCRYLVVDIIDAPHTKAVVRDYDGDTYDGWGEQDEYCNECGEYIDADSIIFSDCHCGEELTEELTDAVEEMIESAVIPFSTPDDAKIGVAVGDVFEDADSRPGRKGRTVTVESLEGDNAVVTSKGILGTRKRSVKIERLLSRKYHRVS